MRKSNEGSVLVCAFRASAIGLLSYLIVVAAVRADTLLFFAAASTGRAVDEIAALYGSQNAATVRVSLAASSTLAVQIANGAPADIFLSANVKWMDYLDERKLIIPTSRTDLLGNKLALIARADNPVALEIAPGFGLLRALGSRRLSVADPDHVPAGMYAKAALKTLGVWQDVMRQLVPAANVRAAVELVARGETPLGIAYQSDVQGLSALRAVATFPRATHPPIVYPLALVANRKIGAARRFAGFLRSPQAIEIFNRAGFTSRVDR